MTERSFVNRSDLQAGCVIAGKLEVLQRKAPDRGDAQCKQRRNISLHRLVGRPVSDHASTRRTDMSSEGNSTIPKAAGRGPVGAGSGDDPSGSPRNGISVEPLRSGPLRRACRSTSGAWLAGLDGWARMVGQSGAGNLDVEMLSPGKSFRRSLGGLCRAGLGLYSERIALTSHQQSGRG